ncbi:Uncharacterised protein [Halioglobus japonicus]|nr:Uncharacterised protein [Halioglobus japonicus]
MIIKANQRGGGTQLANHLLNANDNDHVTVHEISGFMADSVYGAMQEAYAVSNGTRCRKYLFSVSFNPPEREAVSVDIFEGAINRAEEKLGLKGQPRVIIFHEKEGRRHAHAAWSRIDGQAMKAIRQDYYKNRLMDLAKELHLENDWKLPQGFIDRELRNPLNFTHQEWMHAKRLGEDPRLIKAALKSCWKLTETKQGFEKALSQNGYYLAQGNRRSFVAVDWRGEVYSLSRGLKIETTALKERLGEPGGLPTVDEAKANVDKALAERMQRLLADLRKRYDKQLAPLVECKRRMKTHHEAQRQSLALKQEKQRQQECLRRKQRLNTGLRGMWDRLSGQHSRTRRANEDEAYKALVRDREERDHLIFGQLQERQSLQTDVKSLRVAHQQEFKALREAVFSMLPEEKLEHLRTKFTQAQARDVLDGPVPEP